MKNSSYVQPQEMVANICEKATLTEDEIWTSQEFSIWKADEFVGAPIFYPVYRDGDYYSYSPLLLAVRRGHIQIDRSFLEIFPDLKLFAPIDACIDQDVERVGNSPDVKPKARSASEYTTAFAEALQQDVDLIEQANPGKTNFVLCGGKDSLNLLLLDYRNKVVALSAQPNFPLVQKFVIDNQLDIEVVELKDFADPDATTRETAESLCRYNLKHFRWGSHLIQIARESNFESVFWLGAMADAFLTPYWQTYSNRRSRPYRFFRSLCRKWIQSGWPGARWVADKLVLPDYQRTIWVRGAAWQGCCIAHYRSITNCLTLSSYHGPNTANVWKSADLYEIVRTRDIRADIGRCILGIDVVYPASNPGPPESEVHNNSWTIEAFKSAVQTFGVEIRQ